MYSEGLFSEAKLKKAFARNDYVRKTKIIALSIVRIHSGPETSVSPILRL